MRRTPDKQTILKLKADGLTQEQIARQFGVSRGAISWAIYHIPKPPKYSQFSLVPSHVISYWREKWGWTDEQVKEACDKYAKAVMRR